MLCKVYKIGNVKNIHKCGFIYKRNIRNYKVLFEKINSDFKEKNWFEVEKEYFTNDNVAYQFKKLWQFRMELSKIVDSGYSLSEASPIYTYPFLKIDKLSSVVKNQLYLIEDVLCMIISPENISFSIDFLITEFNYPSVDHEEWDNIY